MTKKPAQVFHFDLYGKRDKKYDFLNENSIQSIDWNTLQPNEPNYFLVSKNFEGVDEYEKGFKLDELFNLYKMGTATGKDDLFVDYDKKSLESKLLSNDINFEENEITTYNYRLFDKRKFLYNNKLIQRLRVDLQKHFFENNFALVTTKILSSKSFFHSFISQEISDRCLISNKGQEGNYFFPLYLYPETTTQQTLSEFETLTGLIGRVPNLNMEIVNEMATKLGIEFVAEKPTTKNPQPTTSFAPIDILDYIYAVLHSPSYREKYKEFLKIDFPRVPYPKDQKTFFDLVALGSQLRQIHLLESDVVDKLITQYPEDGNNIVLKPRFENSPSLKESPQGGVVHSPPLEGCPQGGVVHSPPLEGCPQGGVVADLTIKTTPIFFNPKLDLPCNIKLKPRAKKLRQAENLSEVLFWMQVTKGQFYKIDFDRQRIIGNYIVDFYVKKLGLIIEIDGSSHDNKQEYDAERDAYFESLGLKVYHIPVVEVFQQMRLVMQKLEGFIINNYNSPINFSETKSPEDNLPSSPTSTPSKEENLPPHPTGTPPEEGKLGNVFINETQYFKNVPEVAWNFYIGGYQPAQKWLKDRKGRELSYEDILHYQKIIVALTETDRLMKEIDLLEI